LNACVLEELALNQACECLCIKQSLVIKLEIKGL